MDNLNKEQRKRNMQHIKSKDTSIELKLCKALHNCGIHYYKNYRKLPGKPDIAITKYKIAVFCDSEFFHGKDWELLEQRLANGEHSDYWIRKIRRNRARDREINERLFSMGWTVIRFWGKEINKDIDGCVKAIKELILDNNTNYLDD